MQSPPGELRRNQSLSDIYLKPSLRTGVWTGSSGLIVGSIVGIFRSRTPVYFAIAAGIESFGLGGVFWFFRTGLLRSQIFGAIQSDQSTMIKASTSAGAATGVILGLVKRSPRTAIPGSIIFSVLGFSGQKLYNALDERHTIQIEDKEKREHTVARQLNGWWGFIDRLAASKWVPLQRMSNKEYEEYLQEKLVAVEAEISLIDDRIRQVKKEEETEVKSNE